MIPETHRDILAKAGFAHIATIGPSGEPHSSPVWYDWDGRHFLFSQTKTRQKYRNLQRDSRIAVSITDPDNAYRYLEIRGTVDGIEDDEGNAFINAMAKKYMGQDVYPWHQPDDERIVIKVKPAHTTSMG